MRDEVYIAPVETYRDGDAEPALSAALELTTDWVQNGGDTRRAEPEL